MTDEQLSALLRLKRYEQPAPQYFDRLLQDIHRRQRAELLRRPLWKIAAERVQTFFSEHSIEGIFPTRAGALASVLVVGLTGIGFLTSGVAPAWGAGARGASACNWRSIPRPVAAPPVAPRKSRCSASRTAGQAGVASSMLLLAGSSGLV